MCRTLWRRRLLALALGTVVALLSAYVGLNLLYINFAAILHHFTFQVVVVDAATGNPLSGAAVGWHRTNPSSGIQWFDEIGTTDGAGRLTFEKTIQDQPLWLWPTIGAFRFRSAFHVGATGYDDQIVALADALPDVPYSRPEGLVRVRLVASK